MTSTENIINIKNEENIYTVFSRTTSNENFSSFNLLKRAFKTKTSAYEYAVYKISSMLNEISNDYKQNSKCHTLPIHASVIYTLYNMKHCNIEKYEYFLAEYNSFFHGVNFDKTMFFVSEHKLVD